MWPSFRGGFSNDGCSRVAFAREAGQNKLRSIRLGGLVWGTPVLDAQGRVYVGSTNKRFYCLSADLASILWSYKINNAADALIDSAACLNPETETVVVPGGDGCLHCLRTVDGTAAWVFRADGATDEQHRSGVVVNSFEGNVACSRDYRRFYAGCDNSYVYCIDAMTGNALWEYRTDMMVWTVPAVLALQEREVVLVGSLDGRVYCLDGLTGRCLAKHSTGGEVKASVCALDANHIYACNSNGAIARLKLLVGTTTSELEVVWHVDVDAEIYASPAVKLQGHGIIVVTTMAGEVLAFDCVDGRRLWRLDIFDYSTSSPIITADNVVVLGNSQGRLVAVSLETGSVLGVRVVLDASSTGSVVDSTTASRRRANLNSSPAHAADGSILIGSYDGRVYRVSAPWLLDPMRQDSLSTLDSTRTVTHLQDRSTGEHILSFRLNAFDSSQKHLHNASVDASSLKVAFNHDVPPDAYRAVLSPDGKFVNLVPHGFGYLARGASAACRLQGSYYLQSESWIRDRINFHRAGDFSDSMDLASYPTDNRTSAGGSFFRSLLARSGVGAAAPVLRWDISELACDQPLILDTYIPAAMDGQGFIAHACGFVQEGERRDAGRFWILCLPAIPDVEEPFEPLREPGRVVVLRARWQGSAFQAWTEDGFGFSAMGGTIRFADFRLFGRVDAQGNAALQFYARASCLRIQGNGSPYRFSPEIVNQLCDHRLQTHVVGSARAVTNARANVRMTREALSLVVWFDPVSGAVRATLEVHPAVAALSVRADCGNLLVVDGEVVWPRSGGTLCAQDLVNPPKVRVDTDWIVREVLLPSVSRAACEHARAFDATLFVLALTIIAIHAAVWACRVRALLPILLLAAGVMAASLCKDHASATFTNRDVVRPYARTAVAAAAVVALLVPSPQDAGDLVLNIATTAAVAAAVGYISFAEIMQHAAACAAANSAILLLASAIAYAMLKL